MRTDEAARLTDTVQRLATVVDSVLRGGAGHDGLLDGLPEAEDDTVVLAATRVLGADLLAPCLLAGYAVGPHDLAVIRAALRTFPPTADPSAVSAWSHWGLAESLRIAESDEDTERAASEPDATWVDGESWPTLTYRLAALAALAHPAGTSTLTAGATRRTEDVARGFVRSVRRRDWLQAAGAGRWLATMPDCPPSLGLDAGLRFLDHMGAGDARVSLRVSAARLLRNGAG